MRVEKLKYTIWAADSSRAVRFYTDCFGAIKVGQNSHITELAVAGGLISIHGGGEGNKTWTGLTFQVADVVAGARPSTTMHVACRRRPVGSVPSALVDAALQVVFSGYKPSQVFAEGVQPAHESQR